MLMTALTTVLLQSHSARASDSWIDVSTGKTWQFLSHSIQWSDALAGCDAAIDDQKSVYRLPTLNEWWEAYDRIKSTPLAHNLQKFQLSAWTFDALPGTVPEMIWTLFLQTGNAGAVLADDLAAAACISD